MEKIPDPPSPSDGPQERIHWRELEQEHCPDTPDWSFENDSS